MFPNIALETLRHAQQIFDSGGKAPKPRGPFMRVDRLTARNVQVPNRADRRNAARANHELGAWKLAKNHVQTHQGTVIVPYPLRST